MNIVMRSRFVARVIYGYIVLLNATSSFVLLYLKNKWHCNICICIDFKAEKW